MVFNGVLGVYCTSYLVMSYGFRVHIRPDSTACQILVYGPSISTCEMKQVVVSLPSDMTGFERSQLLVCGSAFGLFPISISKHTAGKTNTHGTPSGIRRFCLDGDVLKITFPQSHCAPCRSSMTRYACQFINVLSLDGWR